MNSLNSRELRWRAGLSAFVAVGATALGIGLAEHYKNILGNDQDGPVPAATKLALEQDAEPRAKAIAQSLVDLTLLNPAEASVEFNPKRPDDTVVTAISFAKGEEFITRAVTGANGDWPDAQKTHSASIETINPDGSAHEIQIGSIPDVSGPPIWFIKYFSREPGQNLRLTADSFPTQPYGSFNSRPVQRALRVNQLLGVIAHQELSKALGLDAYIVEDTQVI